MVYYGRHYWPTYYFDVSELERRTKYVVPSTGPTVVSLQDLKEYIGIPAADNSDDLLLDRILRSAIAQTASYLKEPIGTTDVEDLFHFFRSNLTLSENPSAGIAVSYIDTDGMTQPLEADQYFVDASGRETVLRFETYPDLSNMVQYPVSVKYEFDSLGQHHAQLAIEQKIQELALVKYQNRSRELPNSAEQMILNQLASFRRKFPV